MASPIDAGHCPDAVLLALVHEQPFEGALAGRAHVATCATCGARLREIAEGDAAVGALLAELDHPAPREFAPPTRGQRTDRLRRGGLAAAAAVVLGTATLAALPASPLHQWLFSRNPGTAPPTATPDPADGPAGSGLASGIAIPGSPVLVIRFVRDQREGELEISRVPGSDVAFRSRGGTTAYDVTAGAVVVDNLAPAAAYLVDLPSVVREVHVTAGGRTVLDWPADSARRGQLDMRGTIRVPLTPVPETP